jgi:hypothetical protein
VSELTKDLLFVACEVNCLHTANLLLDWPRECSSWKSREGWSSSETRGEGSAGKGLGGGLLPRCSSQRLREAS